MDHTRSVTSDGLHIRTIQSLTRTCNELQAQLTLAQKSVSTLQAEIAILKRNADISYEAKRSLEQTIVGLRNDIAQLKSGGAATPEMYSDDEELEVLSKNVRWEDIESMLGEVVGNGDAATDDFRFDIKSVGKKRWSGEGVPNQE